MADVSVVVSTFAKERLDSLLDCISSLKKQTHSPSEIILVLDPQKELYEFCRSKVPPEVKIVRSSQQGLSNARNAGIREAKGEVVAFIDDDAIADARWIECIVGDYVDQRVLSVGGLVKPVWKGGPPSWFPEELGWVVGCSYQGLPTAKTVIRNPIGCNMSFRREVFSVAGFFNPEIGRVGNKLMGHEDTEFGIRLTQRFPCGKVLFDPGAVVYHKVAKARTSLKYLVRRSYAEGFSKAFFSQQKSSMKSSLTVEKNYLRSLLLKGVLGRLTRRKESKRVSQVFSLILTIWMVSLGYFIGKYIA